MRGIWEKAEPVPSELAVMAAKQMRIIPTRIKHREKILALLKKKWTDEDMEMKDVPDFEAALVGLGKDYCRKGFCNRCPMKCECRQISE
jgi:adenine-specific DNA glycosylase